MLISIGFIVSKRHDGSREYLRLVRSLKEVLNENHLDVFNADRIATFTTMCQSVDVEQAVEHVVEAIAIHSFLPRCQYENNVGDEAKAALLPLATNDYHLLQFYITGSNLLQHRAAGLFI